MIELSGYVFSSLREGPFTLDRGIGSGFAPILVVAPAGEYPSPGLFRRLEHEYALRKDLDADWAARPIELARHDGRLILLLEDPGGELLERRLGRKLEVAAFIRIAIPLAVAVGRMHARGLIHKDLKPANILVDPACGGVWLTGFGIASRLPREHQAPAPPEVIAGTLAYMAPEQTGRMNRSIDSRSDLYALGVIFYEMLTGTLPFTASEPMEWVHCHIARQPVPPDERVAGIAGPLSAIVMKLLAKTAEDRYQTAAGLTADLQRCLAVRDATGRIAPFVLGARDASDRLLIPERLYGRERETGTLLAAFDRVVANGAAELVLVSGYSGVGKSSVVNELHRALVPPRGLFASGKFDQFKRDIPYATLAQAFQGLVRPLLGQSEAALGQWREALREALGPNGQLMVTLVPELELVIGPQPPLLELPPQDAQNRFRLVFRRFLAVFARPEHPLALFLDDLQWLDMATLDLLEHLVTHSEVRHLLLVGAYRDNEVGPAHPLARTLEAIRAAGTRVQEIVLAPLGLEDVGQLVADALHSEPACTHQLAQLVHEKTSGNPFFAIQFFKALAEEELLAFNRVALSWQWDIDRIRTKGYTDNAVDLVAGKLKRLPVTTQEALKQLACLGNVADIAALAMVHGTTGEAMRDALWEAVRAGFIFHQDGTCKFLHDRIQQAAYSLIPEEHRAEAHLRIGRVLLASMTADVPVEHLFDVANQLNRGAARLTERDEKARVAMINLNAGRKAKASAAHVSACVYLSAGMALLDESEWASHYELTFSLWLERAECEFLTGGLDMAEQLIVELLRRGASKIDLSAAYHLKVLLHVVRSEYSQAVASALACLHLFGIDLPAHPTWGQVHAEYEMVWRNLEGRPIEGLIDLPLMIDPELQAAMRLLSALSDAAYNTNMQLFCLQMCRMVNITARHGVSGGGAHAFGYLGMILGPVFHRYREGYDFARLACDLVEKHGFLPYRAKVRDPMALGAIWTQPIATAIDFNQAVFRTAIETGDLTYACYSMIQSVTYALLRNDPLDAVWRESETALDFARKAKFRDVADGIVSQQRFIATMQGRTLSFSTFSDAQFNEAAFEAQLDGDRMAAMICAYWIIKLRARFVSGDYAEALAAANKAKALLWALAGQIQWLDYFYYTALTVAAQYESASADEQTGWHKLLTAHLEQLREWAENYPPTFGDKHALVSAEIARLKGRDLDAMRLYEQAIRSAREHGFIQNEGLAHEVAARFYVARGFETFAHTYLRNARHCYLRWGAEGKVRQLEQSCPQLRQEQTASLPTTLFATSVGQLDIGAVLKASQAVSSEIVRDRLIETLMTIALETAGASRGLLILLRDDTPRIEAEARIGHKTVEVALRQQPVTPATLPEALLYTVIRTQQSVILDDALAQNPFPADEYIRRQYVRSVLCLPLVKLAKLVGVLYLENNLASHVFTPARISVLELLASQAAISLENARLYAELRVSEDRWRSLFENVPVGAALVGSHGRYITANQAFQNMIGYSEAELRNLSPVDVTHEDDRAATKAIRTALATGIHYPQRIEKRYRRKDGGVVWGETSAFLVPVAADGPFFAAVTVDLTERKRAEEALRDAQSELARMTRLTTLGELAASLGHELNQPLAAIVTSAGAGLRWLSRQTPDLDEVQAALSRIVQDGTRAGDVIRGLQALARKSGPQLARLDIDDAIQEVLALTRGELQRHGVVLQTDLSAGDRPVLGDRIQLQQVLLNLIMNAVQVMAAETEQTRELTVSSTPAEPDGVLVAVEDTGPGLDPAIAQRIFEPFFTTKSDGLGMGLSICRSIVEAHGGHLWVSPRAPHGTAFHFTVPIAVEM